LELNSAPQKVSSSQIKPICTILRLEYGTSPRIPFAMSKPVYFCIAFLGFQFTLSKVARAYSSTMTSVRLVRN